MKNQEIFDSWYKSASLRDQILLFEYITKQNEVIKHINKRKKILPKDFFEVRDQLEAIYDLSEENGVIKQNYQSILDLPVKVGIRNETSEKYDRISREKEISLIKNNLENLLRRKLEASRPKFIRHSGTPSFVTSYEEAPEVYDDMARRLSSL